MSNLLPTPQATDGCGARTPEQVANAAGQFGPPKKLNDYVVNEVSTDWGEYEPAIRRWERITRPAPAPTEPNKNGKPRLTVAFDEWMMGLPKGWVDVIDIPYGAKIKLCGNGVVPQQAEWALRCLLEPVRADLTGPVKEQSPFSAAIDL